MDIQLIAGFAVITSDPDASVKLYKEDLGLPLKGEGEYLYMSNYPGSKHFGIWPLSMAAEVCFGHSVWPEDIPVPTSTIEYELSSPEEVESAVSELEAKNYVFIHSTRLEEWGQISARFLSPENVLVGLTYSPWFHE